MSPVVYSKAPLKTKRVYYSGTDTLKTGYALCYDHDNGTASAVDWDRFFIVEKPATANLPYFAGVVHESSNGITGPAYIQIVEPGSMSYVYTDLDCSINVTDLAIVNASYVAQVGAATAARSIGRAMQTVDRSQTNGTVLAQILGTPLTCLLYTSPSPRDATLSRMPSSA